MPERTPGHNSRSDGRIRPSAPEKSYPSLPKTGAPSTAASIKSFVRKILLASPMFPRLYADVVISSDPNSFEAKILAKHYEKIVAYTERTKRMSSLKSCTHIKVTGVRCGSPPLRGEQFCYFHQRMLRTVKDPASRIHHHALLEDEESIQASLMEVVNSLLRGTIELKRAELILRALNTAVRNIKRVKFGLHSDDMVREVPTYSTPPLEDVDEVAAADATRRAARAKSARETAAILAQYHAELAEQSVKAATKNAATATAAPTNGNKNVVPPAQIQPHFGAAVAETPPVGTAAPRYPAAPAVSGPSAAAPKPAPTAPPKVTPRKPAASVKASQAPVNGKEVVRAQKR